jgi:protein ImuB
VDQLVDTFRWLGVHTLGDLASLPRAAVASRFGPLGLGAHRVASGEDRAVAPRKIPEESGVEETFDPPLEDIERASFAARALAGRLTETFGAASPHRVDVEVEAASGEVRVRTWRSSHPFAELDLAERVRWQLRAWIESGGLPGGMVRLRMEPSDLSDRGRQLHLGQDLATEADAERALGRAQGLVGPDSVRQASLQGGRNPLERVQWRRWGEDAIPQLDPASPWPGRLPSPSPALVPPQPQSFDIEWDAGFPVRVRLGSRWEPVLGWSGPWRSTGRWWEGEEAADRYQVVTSAGAFLCEIRQGRTFLVGVYD